jgi:predicted transcriptional regulator of viral defense system
MFKGLAMSIQDFFATRPVFTHEEFAGFLEAEELRSARATESTLAYYTKTGRILRVRRELYVSVPPGVKPDTCPVDPYLLTAKITDDAVLSYHTALEFHGKAYSVHNKFWYLTKQHLARPLKLKGYDFHRVSYPKALLSKSMEAFGVDALERSGLNVRVTSLERTLVDLLDKPKYGGGWEEIWRSLESVEFFDLDKVIEYSLMLENATTAAKVGFFLEQRRNALMVEEKHLDILRKHLPKSPHYMERKSKKPGRYVAGRNLIVPVDVLERTWQEVV